LQRNSSTCAHCGLIFYRLGERTPIVTWSDEAFHLVLYFGPDPRPRPSGGFYPSQLVCNFAYVQDRLGLQSNFLLVLILHAKESRGDALQQVEELADKIAELLQADQKFEAVYTYDEGQLMLGFPKIPEVAFCSSIHQSRLFCCGFQVLPSHEFAFTNAEFFGSGPQARAFAQRRKCTHLASPFSRCAFLPVAIVPTLAHRSPDAARFMVICPGRAHIGGGSSKVKKCLVCHPAQTGAWFDLYDSQAG